jgi:hypothetical protein
MPRHRPAETSRPYPSLASPPGQCQAAIGSSAVALASLDDPTRMAGMSAPGIVMNKIQFCGEDAANSCRAKRSASTHRLAWSC